MVEFAAVFPILSTIDHEQIINSVKYFAIFWLILEIAFYVVIDYFVVPRLHTFKKPQAIENCPFEFFKRILDCLDSLQCYNIERYVSGFCRGANFEDIYTDNFRAFIAWAMFGKHLHDIVPEEATYLSFLMEEIYRRYPQMRNLKPGFNPKVKHTNFTLERVPYIHRPLFLYVLAGLNEFVWNTIILRMSGFQSLEMSGVNYWIRLGSINCNQPPLMIFHGISPGWSLYLLLIKFMAGNRTVVLIDFDAIKIKSMVFYMPSIESFCDSIYKIVKRHQLPPVSIIAHSFGSITSGWYVRRHPDTICHLALIDPVSLLLSFPEVAYNFLYRPPKKFMEYLIHIAASREITVSYALHRNFCWHKNGLWLEDIPSHIGVIVGLASNDEITDYAAIEEYTLQCQRKRQTSAINNGEENIADITCKVWNGYSHGQILLSWDSLRELKRLINASEKLHVKKVV